MSSDKIVLRLKPLFEFEFLDNGIRITDDSESNTNQFIDFEEIQEVSYAPKSLNWWLSFLNILLIFFSTHNDYGLYNNKGGIRISRKSKDIIILTKNCKDSDVIKVCERINARLKKN